jgi:methanogenic corrinoid protein MtbC1
MLTPLVTILRDRYLAAQLAGDRREALRLVLEEGLDRGVSAEDIHLGVVAAAQREIGQLWQENRITVAEEHQATAISQLVLAHVFSRAPRTARVGRSIVIGCVEGELHDMAARIAADMLDAWGFEVDMLGASVPTGDLVALLRARRPDALGLSVTMTFHLHTARRAIAEVRAAMGPSFPIVVGGEAVVATPELASDPHVHVSRGTARDLAGTLRAVLGLVRESGG